MSNKKHNLSPSSFQAFTQYLNGEFKKFAIKTASGVWMDMYGVRLDDTSEPSIGQESLDYAIDQVTKLDATAFIKRDKHTTIRMAIEDGETVEVYSRGVFVKTITESNFEMDYNDMTFNIKSLKRKDFVSLEELKILALLNGTCPKDQHVAGEMYMMDNNTKYKVTDFHIYTSSSILEPDSVKVSIEGKATGSRAIVEVTDNETVFVEIGKGFPIDKSISLSDTKDIIDNIYEYKKSYLVICNMFVEFHISIEHLEIKSITIKEDYIGPWAKLLISNIPLNKKIYFTGAKK